MAVPPTYNIPGLPAVPMVDANGALTDIWRTYLSLQFNLSGKTAFMNGNQIKVANGPWRPSTAPLLVAAANDAAAAAAGVQIGQFYQNGGVVCQRQV